MTDPSRPDGAAAFPALPPELTIYTAADTHRLWLDWWAGAGAAGSGAVAVDAAALDSIDGAGLQLLLALQRLFAGHECTLALERPSAVLRAACAAMGAPLLLPADGATA
jgi:ABC-type transporter Mla MlaB component